MSRRQAFPFDSHRTMAEVMRDEANRERKEAEHALALDRDVRLTEPSSDPFARFVVKPHPNSSRLVLVWDNERGEPVKNSLGYSLTYTNTARAAAARQCEALNQRRIIGQPPVSDGAA